MAPSAEVRVLVQIDVTDLTGFKAAAERCSELSSPEPGTLTYDWFLDEETATARLIEAYATVADLITHARGPVATEVGPELMQTCTFKHMDILGDAGSLADQPMAWPTTHWGRPFASLNH